MKLAEKLTAMSESKKEMEEKVANEIVNFFADKFASGEMMETFENRLYQKDILARKKDIVLDFWTYIPGCSETYFGFLGKKWEPEDNRDYEYKGVNLKHIYKDVLGEIAHLAKENFEQEGFEVNIRRNKADHCYETYIIEIFW